MQTLGHTPLKSPSMVAPGMSRGVSCPGPVQPSGTVGCDRRRDASHDALSFSLMALPHKLPRLMAGLPLYTCFVSVEAGPNTMGQDRPGSLVTTSRPSGTVPGKVGYGDCPLWVPLMLGSLLLRWLAGTRNGRLFADDSIKLLMRLPPLPSWCP